MFNHRYDYWPNLTTQNSVTSYFCSLNHGKKNHFASSYYFLFARERFPKNSWETAIPDESKLTDEELTAFVECLKPAVMLAVFNKSGSFDAAGALQNLALIKPDVVLPTLLNK